MSDFEDVGEINVLAVLRGMADPANDFHAAAIKSVKDLVEAGSEFEAAEREIGDRKTGNVGQRLKRYHQAQCRFGEALAKLKES